MYSPCKQGNWVRSQDMANGARSGPVLESVRCTGRSERILSHQSSLLRRSKRLVRDALWALDRTEVHLDISIESDLKEESHSQ